MLLNESLANEVLEIFSSHTREFKIRNACQHDKKSKCLDIHFKKVKNYIKVNETIQLILPAFPAKSPNFKKTRPPHPDLGERLSLRFLNSLCTLVNKIYPAGAKIIICSDGMVFNDLIQVPDENVKIYADDIKQIISEDRLENISLFNLYDYYNNLPYIAMRENLIMEHGEALDKLKLRMHSEHYSKMLFNGMHRFIFEDYSAIITSLSKNKMKHITKEITYRLIQRSNAWSNLILKRFPHAVRLSIHPQYCGSEKLGIMLLKSKDNWATPWHRIVLYDGNNHILMRKNEAENLGAKEIMVNNRFSHYRLI